MPTWTLQIGSETKSLNEWRIQNVQLSRANLTADILTFTAPRAGFDEDPLADYGDEVVLMRDGVIWFRGERQLVPSEATAAGEQQHYTFKGPWRWLEENIFQQAWYNGTLYTSHCLLIYNVGVNIKAILDYALANGAEFEYDPDDLAAITAFPPASEFTEKMCAAAILEQLQFAPDTVVWMDYATGFLRFAQRSNLDAATVRLASYTADITLPIAEQISIIPRPDLQVPSVKINGETINTIDGVQYLVPSVDVYPPSATGREDRAFNAVITLQGFTRTNVLGTLNCATIDTASLEWWEDHFPTLRNPEVAVLTGPRNVTRMDENGVAVVGYPRELLPGGGQIAEWMGVAWQREFIKATFAIQRIDGSDTIRIEDEKELVIELITTDAPAGESNYNAIASEQEGDPSIIGLAQYLYNSLNPLHYQGGVALVQSEPDGTVNLGNVLNLVGSRAEFETMRALIQEVTFNIDSGSTSITFGPPRHLTISDILALLQRFRTRRRWTNPSVQEDGAIEGASGDVTLGEATGNTNGTDGDGVKQVEMIKQGSNRIRLDTRAADTATGAGFKILMEAGGGQKLNIDFANADWVAATNKEIKVKVVEVCVNNQTRRMLVLGSDPW